MYEFIGNAIPGIPYGCGYAIVAVGLVLTYQATGVFNFAYGAQAFVSAFVFALLTENAHWPVWAAFIVAVVLLAPALGVLFDRFLFRIIPNSNTTAKIVVGIALLLGIPQLLLIFYNQNIYDVPSVVFNPNTVYFWIAGQPINGDDLSAVVVTAIVLVAMVILMRFTSLGLQMRGAVESRRLVQLDGVNADRVVSVSWAVSSLLAGLAGVLLSPLYGQFSAENYVTLMVAAVAAAAWAALRSLPIAALAGVLIGVVELLLQNYLPTSSVFYTAVLPSLPFLILVVALLVVPGMRELEQNKDPMASVDPPPPPPTAQVRAPQMDRIIRVLWYVLLVGFIISMLTWMPTTWESSFNQGLAYSTIFLSITLITGMAGQLSLAQGTLAGVGAFTAALMAEKLGLNMLVGGLVGAVFAAIVAMVLAVLSLRLKGIGLALMTLAAALFFDTTVFSQPALSPGTGGLDLKQSWIDPFNFFNPDGHSFFVLGFIVLVVCSIVVLLVKKGTVGQYLSAMRGSETGAASLGINLTWQRILVFALSGAIAGVGGMLLALQGQAANANDFNYQFSLIFVMVVVTTGVGTIEGAIQAGMGFVIIQQILYSFAPSSLQNLTVVLFAFGALNYASHPEGILESSKRRQTLRFQRLFFKNAGGPGDLALSGAGGGGQAGGGVGSSRASEAVKSGSGVGPGGGSDA